VKQLEHGKDPEAPPAHELVGDKIERPPVVWSEGRWHRRPRTQSPLAAPACYSLNLKRNLNFRRLRLRGFTGAHDECTLAAIAPNGRLRATAASIPVCVR
jgi:hypothetical protein